MDEERKRAEALWRFAILGPLVSARLEHGDVRRLCEEAAARMHKKPSGEVVRLSPRTIEGWYYAFRKEGLSGLYPKDRSDAGKSRAISSKTAELIVGLKRENPRRSIRRIIKILERADRVPEGKLAKSTVHRLLEARGLSKRPRRLPKRQRLAFRHPFAGDCWMGDVMHGRNVVVDADGNERKPYLHVFLDSATRLVSAARFRLAEKAADFESVLKMGIRKHGRPRTVYVDGGAAQRADSLQLICAELGICLRHCAPYDPESKAGVERFIRTYRDEVEDELGDKRLTLEQLNARLWAWLSTEYHRREHGGTKRVPLDHWLSQLDHVRAAPPIEELDRIFLHRDTRKVRKDSTIRYEGSVLEVRPELVGETVEIRFSPETSFDPADRSSYPTVYLDGQPYCDTVLLDPIKNSTRKRRQLAETTSDEEHPSTGIDPLDQLLDEHARLSKADDEQ